MRPPEGILGRIVAHKREELAQRKQNTPLAELRRRTPRTRRSLSAALGRAGSRFLLEHKRASPSVGLLGCTKDPRAIARAYKGVADAVSVLTDARFFKGSFEDLRIIREEIDVPILCKDFVISTYQVVEARANGADAILLMMSVLDDVTAQACMVEANALGMDALVEVHDEEQLERALNLKAKIIGINHRDLTTMAVDLSVTERLAPCIPDDRVIVAESGIETRKDLDRLAPHVNAFLVGSCLMRAEDVRDAARALVVGRVKTCGLTIPEDVQLVTSAGASFGGLIFAPDSPRCVTQSAAESIAREAVSHSLPLVGVFVNEPEEQVAEIARALSLCAVQLHGDEEAEYIQSLRRRLPPECAVWKVSEEGTIDQSAADRLVFDSVVPGQRGGTGVAFDWRPLMAHPRLSTSILAGGIGPDNAALARSVGAWALDVGSRIERAPGHKGAALVAELFTNLRGPGRRLRAVRNTPVRRIK